MHGQTFRERVTDTIPSADTSYTIDLPAGTYQMGMYTKSSITAGATMTVKLFVDKARTQVTTDNVQLIELAGSAVLAGGVWVFTGGANQGDAVHLLKSANAAINPEIVVSHGVRLDLTKSTSVAGEVFQLFFIATLV